MTGEKKKKDDKLILRAGHRPTAVAFQSCSVGRAQVAGSPPKSSLNFLPGARFRGRHVGTP